VTDTDPRNNLSWRVTVLERDVDRLKEGKPDVIAERVTRLSGDIENLRRDVNDDFRSLREEEIKGLRDELATQRRILIGSFISIATALLIAYAVGGGGVPS